MAKKSKLTLEQKALIRDHLNANIPVPEVARMVSEKTGSTVNSHQVNGIKQYLKGQTSIALNKAKTVLAAGPKETETINPPHSSGTPSTLPPDGFDAQTPSAPAGGEGFDSQSNQMQIEYDVYRTQPNDGYLGRVEAPFGVKELTDRLGDGVYEINKLINGRHFKKFQARIGGQGFSKFLDGRFRSGGNVNPQIQMEPYGIPHASPQNTPDPTHQLHNLTKVAKDLAHDINGGSNGGGAHVQAVQASLDFAHKMSQSQTKNYEASSDWFQKFLAKQEEDRRRERIDETTRREEEEKRREAQHKRDLDRIREEYRLERDRIKAESEAKREREKEEYERRIAQDKAYMTELRALESERTREANKWLQKRDEDLKNQLAGVQESLKEESENLQTFFSEIHKVKIEALEKQEKFQEEKFKLQKEAIEKQNGNNAISQMIGDGLHQIGQSVERGMFLKSIERMPQEAKDFLQSPAATALLTGQLIQQNGAGKNGHPQNGTHQNGTQKKAEGDDMQFEDPGNASMQDAVEKVLKSKFFQELSSEWALHIDGGMGPAIFTQTFLKNMQVSMGFQLFANYMMPRPWVAMRRVMGPYLKSDVEEVFEKQEAEEFYNEFRKLLNSNIQYSLQLAGLKVEHMKEQRGATGGNGSAQPAPKPKDPIIN